MKYVRHALKSAVNLLLPPMCPVTREVVDDVGLLHASAWQMLRPITAPYCHCCGIPMAYAVENTDMICASCLTDLPAYDMARAALVYDDVSRKMLLGFKHGDQQHLRKPLAQQLARLIAALGEAAQGSVLVPVPLHRFRLWARRYNQAALLATSLADLTGLDVCVDALIRTRATESQGHKRRADRRKNVAGAFLVNPERQGDIRGRTVMIVDDVMTTGSTFESCAKALIDAGAAKIICLSVARVVHDE